MFLLECVKWHCTRWGVALVGVILTGHCSPRRGTHFQVQGLHQWTALRRGRDYKEGRHVALENIFVKSA